MRITPIIASIFSLLLSLTAFGQPAPINRRAFALTSLANANISPCGCTYVYPTNVASSTLYAWWEADAGVYKDAGTTPAADGDTVQQWNDMSGNGRHLTQGTSGKRPVYKTPFLNSLPVVAFTNKALDVVYGSSLGHPVTYFIVYQVNTGSHDPGYIFDGAQSTYGDAYVMIGTSFEAQNNASLGVLATHPTTLDHWFIDAIWFNSTASTSMTNCIQQLTNTLANISSDSMRLGNNHFSDQALTGMIAELVVYSGYVTPTEACGVMGYLKTKWGL